MTHIKAVPPREWPDPRMDVRPWPTPDAEIATLKGELSIIQRRIFDLEKSLKRAREDEINMAHRLARVRTLRLEEMEGKPE